MSEFEIEVRNAITKLTSETRGLKSGIEGVAASLKKAKEEAREMTQEERIAKMAKRLKEAEENAKALAEAQRRAGIATENTLESQGAKISANTSEVLKYAASFAAVAAAASAAIGRVREAEASIDKSVSARGTVSRTVGEAARMAGVDDPRFVSEFAAGLPGAISQDDLNDFAGKFQGSVGKSDRKTMVRALRARAALGQRGGAVAAGNLAQLYDVPAFAALSPDQQAAMADEFTARSGGFAMADKQVLALRSMIGGGGTLDQSLNVLAAAANAGKAGKVEMLADNARRFGFSGAMQGVGLGFNDRDVLGEVQTGLKSGAYPSSLAAPIDAFSASSEIKTRLDRELEVKKNLEAVRNLPGTMARIRKAQAERSGEMYVDQALVDSPAAGLAFSAPSALAAIPYIGPAMAKPAQGVANRAVDMFMQSAPSPYFNPPDEVVQAGARATSAGPFGAGSVTPEAWAALFHMMMDFFKSRESKKVDPVTVGDD